MKVKEFKKMMFPNTCIKMVGIYINGVIKETYLSDEDASAAYKFKQDKSIDEYEVDDTWGFELIDNTKYGLEMLIHTYIVE